MFFVVRRIMGKLSYSMWNQDPRTYVDYKRDKLTYVDIVHLTPLGEQQSLASLRDAWIQGDFDRPSPYKEKDKPEPPPIKKPPKELLGPKE